MWNETESICVEQVASGHQVKHTTPLGTRYHTAASSSVQVFCAMLEEKRVRALLQRGALWSPGLDDAAMDAYLVRLEEGRKDGYTVNYGETSLEEVGISAPVHDHRGDQVGAVLLPAQRFRIPREQVPVSGETVQEAAAKITSRLGGHVG